MRLLAHENFPGEAVAALRRRGHDVAWVRTGAPGSSDPQVLARAMAETRVLIAFDKDFGELAYHAGLPATCGIILFRISPDSPARVAQVAVAVLEGRSDWTGHFSAIEEHRVRMAPRPPTGR